VIKHMTKIKLFISIFFLTILTPNISFAQTSGGISGVISKISELLSEALPVLVALGVVYFIWGVIQYFIADSEEAKNTGKDRIIYGIIGLAVVISVWGLVYLITETFNLQRSAPEVNSLITQTSGGDSCEVGTKLQGLLNFFTCLIGGTFIPFIFALAVLMFVWGAVNFFILNGGEEEKRTQGKQFMLWGIIALAVMLSVWGLVAIFADTFELPRSTLPSVKPVP
jgi:hypothetical protein